MSGKCVGGVTPQNPMPCPNGQKPNAAGQCVKSDGMLYYYIGAAGVVGLLGLAIFMKSRKKNRTPVAGFGGLARRRRSTRSLSEWDCGGAVMRRYREGNG